MAAAAHGRRVVGRELVGGFGERRRQPDGELIREGGTDAGDIVERALEARERHAQREQAPRHEGTAHAAQLEELE